MKTENFYTDLLNNKLNLLKRLDTLNLPIDHPCHCVDRKKIPGTFTDETEGIFIKEFIAFIANSRRLKSGTASI